MLCQAKLSVAQAATFEEQTCLGIKRQCGIVTSNGQRRVCTTPGHICAATLFCHVRHTPLSLRCPRYRKARDCVPKDGSAVDMNNWRVPRLRGRRDSS